MESNRSFHYFSKAMEGQGSGRSRCSASHSSTSNSSSGLYSTFPSLYSSRASHFYDVESSIGPISSHAESSSTLPSSASHITIGFLGACSLVQGLAFLRQGGEASRAGDDDVAEASDDDDYIADVIVAQGAWDPWRQLEIEVIFDQDLSSFSCIYDSSLIFIYFQLFSSFNLLLCMIDILRFGLVESTV